MELYPFETHKREKEKKRKTWILQENFNYHDAKMQTNRKKEKKTTRTEDFPILKTPYENLRLNLKGRNMIY